MDIWQGMHLNFFYFSPSADRMHPVQYNTKSEVAFAFAMGVVFAWGVGAVNNMS